MRIFIIDERWKRTDKELIQMDGMKKKWKLKCIENLKNSQAELKLIP